ncbi:AI-2E family transporter [Candidatus Tachikawaea gelatinosa]|uniref:Putative membrane protein n=1 Tax=Candidatus Tachikawaea gelatinosa TaxID=1410383 RepID=A0A090AS34_9ENTR|nr:AI-2E family transporter [Candidatus Tachikawaea gelatinosa]BAP58665.1 putative membrane protein [Candidatus Tachikawaea gelatinosa]
MKKLQFNENFLKNFFILTTIFLAVITFFLILKPFIISFIWSSLFVISIWPIAIRLEKIFLGRRFLTLVFIFFLLLLIFIVPIILVINYLKNHITYLLYLCNQGKIHLPELKWLIKIPFFGKNIFSHYHLFIFKENPTITWKLIKDLKIYHYNNYYIFIKYIHHFTYFFLQLFFIILFSFFLYLKAETLKNIIYCLLNLVIPNYSNQIISTIIQTIRSISFGIFYTILIQGILGGIGLIISAVNYKIILMAVIILSCLVQLGPLPILLLIVFWLYVNNNSFLGTLLLIWSFFVGVLDNIIKLFLIKAGIDLPIILFFLGIAGGFLAFGFIGLFIGPIIMIIFYQLILIWVNEFPIKKNN